MWLVNSNTLHTPHNECFKLIITSQKHTIINLSFTSLTIIISLSSNKPTLKVTNITTYALTSGKHIIEWKTCTSRLIYVTVVMGTVCLCEKYRRSMRRCQYSMSAILCYYHYNKDAASWLITLTEDKKHITQSIKYSSKIKKSKIKNLYLYTVFENCPSSSLCSGAERKLFEHVTCFNFFCHLSIFTIFSLMSSLFSIHRFLSYRYLSFRQHSCLFLSGPKLEDLNIFI